MKPFLRWCFVATALTLDVYKRQIRKSADDSVSAQEKQTLIDHLNQKNSGPDKLTLQRKTRTLREGIWLFLFLKVIRVLRHTIYRSKVRMVLPKIKRLILANIACRPNHKFFLN